MATSWARRGGRLPPPASQCARYPPPSRSGVSLLLAMKRHSGHIRGRSALPPSFGHSISDVCLSPDCFRSTPSSGRGKHPWGTSQFGRVGMWRGGGRASLSVSAPFVWRCLNSRAITPFPHPAHRTGRADFPHPALGQDFTPSNHATIWHIMMPVARAVHSINCGRFAVQTGDINENHAFG